MTGSAKESPITTLRLLTPPSIYGVVVECTQPFNVPRKELDEPFCLPVGQVKKKEGEETDVLIMGSNRATRNSTQLYNLTHKN
ncbi:MAG: hypothetical protein QXP58_08060 [Thermoprotei archaeon]